MAEYLNMLYNNFIIQENKRKNNINKILTYFSTYHPIKKYNDIKEDIKKDPMFLSLEDDDVLKKDIKIAKEDEKKYHEFIDIIHALNDTHTENYNAFINYFYDFCITYKKNLEYSLKKLSKNLSHELSCYSYCKTEELTDKCDFEPYKTYKKEMGLLNHKKWKKLSVEELIETIKKYQIYLQKQIKFATYLLQECEEYAYNEQNEYETIPLELLNNLKLEDDRKLENNSIFNPQNWFTFNYGKRSKKKTTDLYLS